jgi:integrase
VERWQGVFRKLKADFPNRGAGTITSEEAQTWITGLIGKERSAGTVKDVWLPAAKRVFGWAAKHKHVATNPFKDVSVEKPKKITTRHKWFTQEEQALILKAASAHTNPETTAERARRWVPWLLAYTGARAGEITQLRGSDVGEHEGVLAVHLTPDAGTMKTNEARWVPIHEHLVDQGFLEFVAAGGMGPLFYDPPKNVRVKDKLKPSTAPAQIVRMRLGEWTREIGIVGKLSPLHAWRHTFKRLAARVGIPEQISDAITGHKQASLGRTYGAPSVGDMADALKRFPRYVVD